MMMTDLAAAPWRAADPGGARLLRTAPIAPETAAVADLKAYLRIDGAGEDALLGRLLASAIAHGEAFTRRLLIARAATETVPAIREWRRLTATPVSAITGAAALPLAGDAIALPPAAFAIDIDANGDGWVRVLDAGGIGRVGVDYRAGLAATWGALPEALRQGCVRLASHLYAHRDAAEEGAPPAAVAALWRPWRRMQIL